MNVLLTGGTGFIGKELQKTLRAAGHQVRILSRKRLTDFFYWNVTQQEIDANAFKNLDAIIHLAGEPVAQRWTKKSKEKILNSRTHSAQLLFENAKQYAPNLKVFISASGSNYYGTLTQSQAFEESDSAANDFLGDVCQQWEESALKFNELGTRVVMLRTGIVLGENGGALKKMLAPFKMGIGSAIGSGKQFMPWIHLTDLCNMYLHALENPKMSGAYNAVAPENVNNSIFTQQLNQVLRKKSIAPNVPAFILKLMYGDMANILLEGSPLSSEKIIGSGFSFEFSNLKEALQNILSK